MSKGKIIRRSILAAVCLLLIIIGHVAGVFGALVLLAIWGMSLLGVWAWRHIYLGGLDRIAEKNANAMVSAQEKARIQREGK